MPGWSLITHANVALLPVSGKVILIAYDPVQVASALTLPPPPQGVELTLVSADEGLLTVTKKLGCPIENPNLHP